MFKFMSAFTVGALLVSSASIAEKMHVHSNGPFDAAIANEDRLIDMLKRSGKISSQASIAEAHRELNKYLHQRRESGLGMAQDLADSSVQTLSSEGPMHTRQHLKKHKHGKRKHFKFRPDGIELENYDGPKRTAKVLTILMEFPDFPHNSIGPDETDMFYEDYNRKHYEDLLFSKSGVEGPNGENFISMINYYEAQSGNSYSVEGTVAGWYMAENPAAFYGGNNAGGNDVNARQLVREALAAAAADPEVDLADFDIEDRYDLDGDGDLWEPDGLVDHVQIFHSSVGEEAGGGQLAEDAIWSHRWNLGAVFPIEGTSTEVTQWGGMMAAYDYTVQPADAAAGVVSHEYGHDLGLPDEYDTQYTGQGEPVSSWSVMSSGSWAGLIPGSEPTGFSAWSKEFLQQAHGGNWLHGETLDVNSLSWRGEIVLLDEAVSKGRNNDAVRINLPDKETVVNIPTSGQYSYFSGKGNNLNNTMSVTVDLTTASSATLTFKAWYDIEQDWDYGYITVDDGNGAVTIAGNITVTTNPNDQNQGNGITGASTGWTDAEFDLSAYAGKSVIVSFVYSTDSAAVAPGFYADDIMISADDTIVVTDNADSTSAFDLAGFTVNEGIDKTQHYYLLEWRVHHGVDAGLAHVKTAGQLLPFNEGLIIWYVDASFDDNWVGQHPGQGFLGVVDADQRELKWSDDSVAITRYQIHDAAFNIRRSKRLFIDQTERFGTTLTDNHVWPNAWFSDYKSYLNELMPDAGRIVPKLGLNIVVLGHSKDKSVAKVWVRKSHFRPPMLAQ